MKRDREEALTLEILEAIDTRSDVTQRHLAEKLGVALGLANSYLRRCVRKGLVKIQQAPANRYLYYLTPMGFAEKSRLTGEYLVSSLDYYKRAGESFTHCYRAMEGQGQQRVLFATMSELAEIALVRAYDFELEIVGTYDPGARVERFLGRPVWTTLSAASGGTAEGARFDAALLTDIAQPAATCELLHEVLGEGRVYVPEILRPVIGTTPQGAAH